MNLDVEIIGIWLEPVSDEKYDKLKEENIKTRNKRVELEDRGNW